MDEVMTKDRLRKILSEADDDKRNELAKKFMRYGGDLTVMTMQVMTELNQRVNKKANLNNTK